MSKNITQAMARPGLQGAVANNPCNLVRWPVWPIIKPDDLICLLRLAGPNSVVPLALAAFAGLRWAELAALDWEDIELDQRQIQVTTPPAPRAAPIPDNLATWLRSSPYKNGPVRGLDFKAEMSRLGTAIGVSDLATTLHASFAAYRAALIRDWAQVGAESGDSALMLRLQSPAKIWVTDAKAWFRIVPDSLRA